MRCAILGFLLTLCLTLCAGTARADKSYANPDLASDAIRLVAQVKKDGAALANNPTQQLRKDAQTALDNNDGETALKSLAGLLAADPDDAAAWLSYSRAMISTGDSDDIAQTATTAAYLAYLHAPTKTDAAAALAVIGDLFAKRQIWRASLDAYKASLDLAEVPAVRAIYAKERETYGFRILDYKVDKDSASPRACFQFSEVLARGHIDFASYVSVAGIDNPAISTEDQQICVEGLKHGEHYAISLRQGIPSAVGEQLLHTANYDIYVRDRAPQAHFTGKNYVLPRVGQQGIPVVSVNTKKIAIEIIRIGDRNLLSTVHSSDFLSQLSSYRLKQYVDSDGVKIWSGSLAVTGELNQDVTTDFPVLEALGKLDAGVYVMTAKPAELAASDDDDADVATQWFIVSDLGLTAFSGRDGVHVFVRSLTTAKPIEGISLRLVARDNEVLATKASGSDGYVRFEPGLARGTGGLAPGLVIAEDGKGDYGFLDLQATAFDLTDRGDDGRQVQQPLDAQVFTERGVYRSGETVFMTALLRDAKGTAKEGIPMTLVVERPDGVEYKRALVDDQGEGGRTYALPLLSSSASGTWRVEAYVDPKGEPVGETTFLVEDYVPETFRLHAEAGAGRGSRRRQCADRRRGALSLRRARRKPRNLRRTSGRGGERPGPGGARRLSGRPARRKLRTGQQRDLKQRSRPTPTASPRSACLSRMSPASQPLEAKIILRAGEPGGRAVERSLTLPILPKGGLLGVKKDFDTLGEGAIASFDVIAINSDAKRVARKAVTWSLNQITTDYQWYNQDGHWDFEQIKSSRRVADGKIDLAADAPAKISVPVDLGFYRLDVKSDDPNDAPTSVTFSVGWSGEATADTPDLLSVTLDKKDYKPGEAMKLKIASHFAGTATVAILGDALNYTSLIDLQKGDNIATVPVSADWGAGAYAVVLAHRPLDQAGQRMPGRALGLAWFSIDAQSHKIGISLGVPAKVRPRGRLDVPITLAGLSPGEEAYVTVAAVDVGILNLTHYVAPDPSDYFYGQRQLGTEIRDIYGLLIDGMQGTRGEIRSGGDSGGELEGNKPTQAPLALFSGMVKVGADGKAHVGFDLPAFNGSVRLTAVAFSQTKVGSTSTDVIVRDPVVVQATLPRFLDLNDSSRFHLEIDNVEGAAGDYTYEVGARGALSLPADAAHGTIKLATDERTSLSIPLVGSGLGEGDLDFKLSGPGFSATQSFTLDVEPGTSSIYRRIVRRLLPGQSFVLTDDLLAEFVQGTGRVSAAVSNISGIDVAALLHSLDVYPFECSEQLVSRAMPLLYVNKLADPQLLALNPGIADRIKKTIDRLMSRQDSNGAFGLWSADDANDIWLDAFVTDFLTRAREQNYDVPQKSFDMALERLRNYVANTTDVDVGPRRRARLCGLCSCPQWPAGDGGSALSRRCSDRRIHEPAGARPDCRRARFARRSRPGGKGFCRGRRKPGKPARYGLFARRFRLAPARRRRRSGARRRGWR